MKKGAGFLMAMLLLSSFLRGQDHEEDYIQNPTLGVHFLMDDFKSAAAVRASSLGSAITNKQFGKLKDMSPGLAINYIQGMNAHFDFSITLAGSFLDYPQQNREPFGIDHFLLEGDVSVRGKMLPNKYWVSPYLQLGVGASMYEGYYGAFIPAGVGLQVNLFDEAFLLINSQYRIPVTETANYHFYHSIGLAGVIGKRKVEKVLPPPPMPQPEPPKDRDGDGVVDSLDACPDVKGLTQFNGCPDTDEDGIIDKDDKCPTQKGVARYQGCPIPDSDGDGINDEEDKCPNQKGVARYQGCPIPDRDGDGVNDEEDKCPDLAGTVANNGCPEVKEEVRKRVEVASKNVFFATGSFRLLTKSNKSLDEVAAIMNADSNLKMDIEGYTDNTGSETTNQQLSEKRASAVMEYLVKKGVDESRLTATGYGEANPVADNKTAAGRATNRRVEMKLHYN